MACPPLPPPVGDVVYEYIPESHGPLDYSRAEPGHTPVLAEAGWDGAYALDFLYPSGNETCNALRISDNRGTSILWKELQLEQDADYKLTVQIHNRVKRAHMGLMNGQTIIFPCHAVLYNISEQVYHSRMSPGQNDLRLGPPVNETEFVDISLHMSMRHGDVNDRVVLALGSGGKGNYYIRLVRLEKVAVGTCGALAADGDPTNDCQVLGNCANYVALVQEGTQPYRPQSESSPCLDEGILGKPVKSPVPLASSRPLVFTGGNPGSRLFEFLLMEVAMVILNEGAGVEARWIAHRESDTTILLRMAGLNSTVGDNWTAHDLEDDALWDQPSHVPDEAVLMSRTPDDITAATEAALPFSKRARLRNLGATRVNIFSSLFVTDGAVRAAAEDNIMLDSWRTLALDNRSFGYFRDIDWIDANSGFDYSNNFACASPDIDKVGAMLAMNWTCDQGQWWISPGTQFEMVISRGRATRAYECIPMLHFDMGPPGQDLVDVVAATQLKVCLTAFDFAVQFEEVLARGVNFLSWLRFPGRYDSSVVTLVNMPTEYIPFRNPFQKVVWGGLNAAHRQAFTVIQYFDISMSAAEELLESVMRRRDLNPTEADLDRVYHETCRWMRQNPDVWLPWLEVSCERGFVNDPENDAQCIACLEGRFSAEVGSKTCEPCANGTIARRPGLTGCVSCEPGQMANATGLSECTRCQVGEYQEQRGKSYCEECASLIRGSTMLFQGAFQEADCTCAPGMYYFEDRASARRECMPCQEGLECPGGRGTPLQRAGFAANQMASGAFKVYACRGTKVCPAGTLPGTCPDGREGLACDLCMPNMYPADDGTCRGCGDASGWAVGLILLIVMLVALLLFFVFTSRNPTSLRQNMLTLGCCAGISVTTMQALGALSDLQIDWIEPMITLRRILSVFSLKIDVVQPNCVFRVSSPPSHYLGSLITFPGMAMILLAYWGMSRKLRLKIPFDRLINSVGLLFLIAYLALALLSLAPFQCFDNPSAEATIGTFRSVECNYAGDHAVMVAISVAAILAYPIGYMAMVAYCTRLYPKRVVEPGGIEWLKRFSFIFQRFSPQCYYYGFIYMTRNLFIALLPSVFPNEQEAQLMLLGFVINTFLFLQCIVWPWRTSLANYVDAAFSIGLNLVMMGGCMLLRLEEEHSQVVVQMFFVVIFFVCFGFALIAALFTAYRICRPPKRYGLFLCHHKGGAAVLARYFKEVLSGKITERIFLDSDELDDLDMLFNIVAEDTKNLVVLLTSEILMRMWCAGEIHTALTNGVNVLPVICGMDFQHPSDDFLDRHLDDVWTDQQKADLGKFGIEVSNIRDAYRRLREIPAVRFPRAGSDAEQEAALAEVLQRAAGVSQSSLLGSQAKRGSNAGGASPVVAIIGNTRDLEAMCVCQVLARLVQRASQVATAVISTREGMAAAVTPELRYVLTVLTRGVLANDVFVELCRPIKSNQAEVIPIVADTSFAFPDPEFYQRLLGGEVVGPNTAVAQEMGLDWVAACYRQIFSTIAITFSAQGSEMIQAAEVKAIQRRLHLESRRAGTSDLSAATKEAGLEGKGGPVEAQGACDDPLLPVKASL